jgi:hypothetical protein
MTDNNGTPETAPAAAPAVPTEGTTPTPAPSAEVTPAPAPDKPAEGTTPDASVQETPPAKPAEPAVETPPAKPRESAMAKRAREAREKAQGLMNLANKLDPTDAPAAPAATPPTQPAPAPTPAPPQPTVPADNLEPDYFDEEGVIDPVKHTAWSRRVAEAAAQRIIDARDKANKAAATQREIGAAVSKYADQVEIDAQYLAANLPELNPESPEYDEQLDADIEADYRNQTIDASGHLIRVDLSLREFAEREVNRIRRYRTKGAASVPNSQVAQGHDGAVVPAANNQPPEITAEQIAAMSADEYEKYLKDKGVKTVQR